MQDFAIARAVPVCILCHPLEACVCKGVLVSGFAAGVPAGLRTEAVEHAAASTTLVTDRSHWGIVKVAGEDRMRFLHSQGTNAFQGVPEGAIGRHQQRCMIGLLVCHAVPLIATHNLMSAAYLRDRMCLAVGVARLRT